MIQHVTRLIQPARLRECVEFYGLLGFREVDPPAGIAGRAVWLERAQTQIHLMFSDDAKPEQGHVGVVIERYEATLAALRRGGYYVEPRREHWGSPRAYVRDPAGHLVEVMAFGPGAIGPEGIPTAR
jgi:catechol 2,3-dioxygenase-like lactoylglutathione lyase family enzyme